MGKYTAKIIWVLRSFLNKIFFGHIGKRCYLGKPIFVSDKRRIYIGDKVRIYPGMRAELVGKKSKITINDNVSIGQNLHIVSYKDEISIGKDVTISGNVFISNCDHSYTAVDEYVLKQPLKYKHTEINDNSFVGYGAVILAGTKLGKECVVGANSVVRGEFPDYSVIAGNPARLIKKCKTNESCWEKVKI